jgi:ABC-type sugar transport system ATPase subunit
MVFQDEVLYPMNVGANIGFPLTSKRLPEAEITARVQAEAKVLGLDRVLGRQAKTLGAGHRHLVQLARAMVRAPDLFLIDEPLGRLDPALRRQLRTELRLIQQGYGVTAVYATHDQEDAMALADRLVIMDEGRIRQIGTGVDVYRRPADLSVASFVGSPAMAMLRGTVTASGVTIDELTLPGPPVVPAEVVVGVRSEDWRLSSSGIPASVTRIENLGSHLFAEVETIAGTATVRLGDEIASVGDEIRLVPTRYHLFDSVTGRSVYHSHPE